MFSLSSTAGASHPHKVFCGFTRSAAFTPAFLPGFLPGRTENPDGSQPSGLDFDTASLKHFDARGHYRFASNMWTLRAKTRMKLNYRGKNNNQKQMNTYNLPKPSVMQRQIPVGAKWDGRWKSAIREMWILSCGHQTWDHVLGPSHLQQLQGSSLSRTFVICFRDIWRRFQLFP